MLLNTYNPDYTETQLIFRIFVSISRPKTVYRIFESIFIFSLIFIVINHITSEKQTHLFFVRFLEYLPFLDGNVNEESE